MNGHRVPMTWPLAVLFAAFPVWWLLGVSAFMWPAVAFVTLVVLIGRGWTRAPAAIVLWLAFLSWVLLSGLRLSGGTAILIFLYRFALYAGAAILFLYVYNMPRSSALDAKVLRILTAFWMVVVVSGYVDILLRGHTFMPPFYHLLPNGLRSKPFIQELVLPVFAQVQAFLGYPVPRPAAPFPYTNQWGGNIAVLTPVALAAFTTARQPHRRLLIIAMLAASLVPMVFSLNRGMFLSLAIGITYVTFRLAMRGRLRAVMSSLALIALMTAIVALTPLGHLIVSSFSSAHGHSNKTRISLYQQASAGVNASPWFGYGAPMPSTGQVGSPPIGTQGQLWMVLYSHGYPALVFFIGFGLAALWQTRHARGTAGLLLHAVMLVALAQIAVYGWLSAEVQVIMVTAALAYRRCWVVRGVPAKARARGPAKPPTHVPEVARAEARADGVAAPGLVVR